MRERGRRARHVERWVSNAVWAQLNRHLHIFIKAI